MHRPIGSGAIPSFPYPAARSDHSLLPVGVLPATIVIFLVAGLGPNVGLAIPALLVFLVGCCLLWRPAESPILLFSFSYCWLQGSLAVFHANWLDMDINSYAPYGGDTYQAVVLTLAGVLFFGIGLRLGAGPWRRGQAVDCRRQAQQVPVKHWLRLYAIALAASLIALACARLEPGISQILNAVATLKWAFFFLLAYAVFVRGENKAIFAAVFLFELLSSIGGYFSDFRVVFFITFFAFGASGLRLTPRVVAGISLFGAALLSLGIVWTAIKGDYRQYASGGESAQVVTVAYTERLAKLSDLVGTLNASKLGDGVHQMLRRLTYVEMFGVTLNYVPAMVPHEHGAITLDAISRPFMPRLFFPDKAAIDDSMRTNKYTGLEVAGASQGTSIGIGWIAEMYVDYGALGILPASLCIGAFFGAVYRFFLRWRPSRGLLGAAVSTAVLSTMGSVENSFTKEFGGVVVSLLMASILIKFLLPRWVPWLCVGSRG